MAVSSTTNRVQYVGNASTVTAYPVSFYFQDEDWINVQVVDEDGVTTTLELGTDYALSGAGDPDGGELTTVAAYPATSSLTIYRVVPITQLLDLVYNDRLPAAQLELALDKLTFIAQQLATILVNPGERALSFPVTEPDSNTSTLPSAAARAGTFLYFNATTGEMEVISGQALVDALEPEFQGIQGDQGIQGETGAAYSTTITTESTTARTLALTDAGTYIRCTNAATTTLTIPVTGTGGGEVDWPVGAEIFVRRAAAGALALSIAGVTVNGSANIAYLAQDQNLCLKHLGASVWDLI